MIDAAEIERSRAVWEDWRARGQPFPMPDVREYLTLAECAARYGSYATARGPVPIVPGHVALVDFACQHCGAPSQGCLEYDGTLVCSRECAALARPDLGRFSDAFRAQAAARLAQRERVRALAAELERLQAELYHVEGRVP